jgi:drug/metabolite transporter (DMT)-like permease
MSWRRGLIFLIVFMVGILLLSRPGDFGAGLVGMVLGGGAALAVVLVEVIGKWLARRRFRSAGKNPSSDEPASASEDRIHEAF